MFVYGATLLETRATDSMTCYFVECKVFVDSVGTETDNLEGKFLFCVFVAFSAVYTKGKTANRYVQPAVTKMIELRALPTVRPCLLLRHLSEVRR